MAKQNTSAPPAPITGQSQDSSYNVSSVLQNPMQQAATPLNSALFQAHQPVNVPGAAAAFAPPSQAQNYGAPNHPSNMAAPVGSQPSLLPPGGIDPALQQQLVILKMLSDQGVPQDQWGQIIAALTAAGATGAVNGAMAGLPASYAGAGAAAQNSFGAVGMRPDESRDRNGYRDRSPAGRYRQRSRSRSPQREWNAHGSPPRRRGSPTFGGYRADDRERGARGRGGRDNDYRQRSPQTGRRGRSPTPPRNFDGSHNGGEKWIDHDASIGKGNIKGILSTLSPSCRN